MKVGCHLMDKKFKIYLASHFFNSAMFDWTESLAQYIEEHCEVDIYVPQRNASINDKKNNDAIITDVAISKADTAELKSSNILIACLDGLTIDDGVAGEIMAHGVMAELEKEYGVTNFPRVIFGLITDMRYMGTGENKLYRNLMIVGKVKEHGELIISYPGSSEYKDIIVEKINKFIFENRTRLNN